MIFLCITLCLFTAASSHLSQVYISFWSRQLIDNNTKDVYIQKSTYENSSCFLKDSVSGTHVLGVLYNHVTTRCVIFSSDKIYNYNEDAVIYMKRTVPRKRKYRKALSGLSNTTTTQSYSTDLSVISIDPIFTTKTQNPSSSSSLSSLSLSSSSSSSSSHHSDNQFDSGDKQIPQHPKPKKNLLGPCSGHTCSTTERCTVHRVTKQPLCVKAILNVLPGHCPVPRAVPNANISSGGQKVESERTYTCHYGYFDTSSDTTTEDMTCLQGSSWSEVTLTCSGPFVRLKMGLESSYVFQLIRSETLNKLTGGTSSLIFLTKTCHDSNFALHRQQAYTSPDDVYEIVIGGWNSTKSGIGVCIGCQLMDVHNENDIVSCNEFRPFWLSWKNSIISVGKGNVVGNGMFLTWTPTSPFPINYVSFASYKNNIGVWLFTPQI